MMKEIEWSAEKPPNGNVSYDHVSASTPLGLFTIEWKSWKDMPSYGLMLDNEYIVTESSLIDAKEAAKSYLFNKLDSLHTYMIGTSIYKEAQAVKKEEIRPMQDYHLEELQAWPHRVVKDSGFSKIYDSLLVVPTGKSKKAEDFYSHYHDLMIIGIIDGKPSEVIAITEDIDLFDIPRLDNVPNMRMSVLRQNGALYLWDEGIKFKVEMSLNIAKIYAA